MLLLLHHLSQCALSRKLPCCLPSAAFPQVRRVFWQLLELCPTPEAAIAADTAAIRAIIAPLGLHNKRAVAVQRLSQDFLHKDVSVLHALRADNCMFMRL